MPSKWTRRPSGGRLAVVALEQNPASSCDGAEPGLSLYDVTEAGRPTLLSESCEGCDGGYRSLSLAARDDGRVLIAAVESRSGNVRILDVTDPASPGSLSTWTHPSARSVSFYGRADRMLVATGDAGVFDLDLTGMASPTEAASWNEADDPPAYATALLLADRTVVIVCEQDLSGRGGGVRVLQLDSGETQPRLRHPQGVGVPGRTVTSGQQAFVAWHSDGVRVYDVTGGGTTKVVAQFVPAQPADVVGVALLPNHVVVTDTKAGLYVLERPEEGSGGSWREKGLLALAAFGIAILAALVVVPRVGMALAMTGVRVPRTVPVRARRAGR